MTINSLSAYRKFTNPKNTLKGYLLNSHIKNNNPIDEHSIELLIQDDIVNNELQLENKGFDAKKALKPLLIATGLTVASVGLISFYMALYSKKLAKTKGIVRPPDLARNINIVEEPHFAMYRALRDPNAKNILGLIGVGIMSAVTLCAKNLTDGIKDIWVKKQECDIDYDFHKDSIDLETKVFSGKLNIINELLSEKSKYFKSVLYEKNDAKVSFKGLLNNENEDDKIDKNKMFPVVLSILGIVGFCGICFGLFKNFQKTVKNLDTFTKKTTDAQIRQRMNRAVKLPNKNRAIEELSDILKLTNATEEKMRINLGKIDNITEQEVQKAIKDIKKAQTYVHAPEALGGISGKIQYYCYINEDRGHLYNWILNPENKFNKYVFLSFSAITAMGYVGKTAADALKDVAVKKENKKTELDLKKRLVDVEIANFKAKKMSAINPLIDNFNIQVKNNKPEQELEELAKNILTEIKNGPPYVYD